MIQLVVNGLTRENNPTDRNGLTRENGQQHKMIESIKMI